MLKPLIGEKIAVLVANGFTESHLLEAQRLLQDMGATLKVISPSQGLVNGWDGQAWGHNFAVDVSLNTALGVDYAGLVIPGGQQSIEKLKQTAHSRRFIGSFMAAQKPVAVMEDAIGIMAHVEQVNGCAVSGPLSMQEICEEAGALWQESPISTSGCMITGSFSEETYKEYLGLMRDIFSHRIMLEKAA